MSKDNSLINLLMNSYPKCKPYGTSWPLLNMSGHVTLMLSNLKPQGPIACDNTPIDFS
ncbi:hypothetical protein LguiA_011543 [Lonicera macranthoides]